MHTFRKLTPGFLLRLDHYLLTHHPAFWATKLHHLAFYLGLAYTAIFLGAEMGVNLGSLPDEEVHAGILGIPIGLAFLFWTWQVSRSKLTAQYGKQSAAGRWGIQLLMLLGVSALLVLPFIQHEAVIYRKATAVPVEELVADIEALERGEVYFEEYWEDRRQGPEKRFRYHLNRQFATAYLTEPSVAWEAMTPADHEKAIYAYYEVLQKYSHQPFLTYDATKIYAQSVGVEGIGVHETFRAAERDAYSNIEDILYARDNYGIGEGGWAAHRLTKESGMYGVIIFLLVGWLAMMIFMEIGLKTFFAGTVMAIIGGMAGTALAYGLSEFAHLMDDEVAISGVYIGAMMLLTFQGMRYNHRRGLHLWKTSGLAVAAAMLPLAPPVLMMGLDTINDASSTTIMLSVVLTTWIGWQFLYQPLLQRLEIEPQRT